MSVDQTAYTWDASTGELIAQVNVESGIREFMVSSTSCYGYLAESNGTIAIVDMNTGLNYSASAIATGKEIKNVHIQNRVLVLQAYASPNLTMMKYQSGAGMVELETYNNYVNEVYYSADENYYAVTDSEHTEFYFYQTEDYEFISKFSPQEADLNSVCGFMGEETFVYADAKGLITYVNVVTGESEEFKVCEEAYSLTYDLNKSCTMALIMGTDSGNSSQDTFRIVDLQNRKILVSGGAGEEIYAGVIAEDGSKAYCNSDDAGMIIISKCII